MEEWYDGFLTNQTSLKFFKVYFAPVIQARNTESNKKEKDIHYIYVRTAKVLKGIINKISTWEIEINTITSTHQRDIHHTL